MKFELLDIFPKKTKLYKYQILWKSVQRYSRFVPHGQIYRRTEMTMLMFASRNFANAPKNASNDVRRNCVFSLQMAPRPLSTPGKDPVPIVQEAGWAPGPVWRSAENLAPTGIRSPDRPARSESLYRLSYRAHKRIVMKAKECRMYLQIFSGFAARIVWCWSENQSLYFWKLYVYGSCQFVFMC
jgi:hypothetical protein